jgi:CxxC-x17-CxxC domain-containing protein
MPDVETICVQCKETFLFTEKDQEMFYQRNMAAPQRCQKFEIGCDNCGKHDQVPFQPKVGRTVFCRDCHEASRSRARFA